MKVIRILNTANIITKCYENELHDETLAINSKYTETRQVKKKKWMRCVLGDLIIQDVTRIQVNWEWAVKGETVGDEAAKVVGGLMWKRAYSFPC